MVRLVHTADLHVGKSRTLPDYLERQSLMIDGIYKVAKSKKANLVLMAGDIFESKNIKWNEQMMFISKLFEYDKKGFTSIICNGNHDELATGASHLWLPAMIQNYGGLKNTHIIDGKPQVVELEDIDLAVIPVVNNNVSTQELKENVEDMYSHVSGEKPFVVMLHATISGANTDTGYSISGGPRIPDLDFVSYWAVGDIHKMQQIGERAYYSGSPIQHNFGEEQPKGVLVVDLEKDEEPQVDLVELKGITPLITIEEKPEVWPTDCYIRYLGPLEGIIELPENVIKTEGVSSIINEAGESVIEQMEFTDSLTEGLDEFLALKSIPEEYRQEGIQWVQEKYNK